MKKYSIVIPMFNVSEYIVRCLNSVFSQSYSINHYEVILVNDGSEDNSEEIARQYCKDKSNVKIISQKNKGLGGARNTGMKHCSAEYIIFLDSDDILRDDFFNLIGDNIHDEDIVEFGFNRISNKDTKTHYFRNSEKLQGTNYILINDSVNSACNKIYKREFLIKNNLYFKEKIYGEDIEFNIRSFLYAENVKSINEVVFGFHSSSNSITRNKDEQRKLKYFKDLEGTIISTAKLINSQDENKIEYLQYRVTSLNVNTLLFALKNKIPKEVVLQYINTLVGNDAFCFKSKLKRRDKFRILLKNDVVRNLLINTILK